MDTAMLKCNLPYIDTALSLQSVDVGGDEEDVRFVSFATFC